jgi:hypothetical protein
LIILIFRITGFFDFVHCPKTQLYLILFCNPYDFIGTSFYVAIEIKLEFLLQCYISSYDGKYYPNLSNGLGYKARNK